MTTLDQIRLCRDEVLELARKHGVTSVRVFGSAARQEDHSESDVDLLVTTGDRVSAWFPAGLIVDLESLLGRKVDVVTEAGVNDLLRERILAESIPL